MAALGYQLFTSLRYDPALLQSLWNTNSNDGEPSAYLMLPYHLNRLLNASQRFGWDKAIAVLTALDGSIRVRQECEKAVREYQGAEKATGLRIRITIAKDGVITATAFPTKPAAADLTIASTFNPNLSAEPPKDVPVIYIILDSLETRSSIFTEYKTTFRLHYDAARRRVGLLENERDREVLLYNERGEVTEGSVRNVAFWRDGKWITPSVSSGCLRGTMRRWLLEQGRVHEGTILKADLKVGEWVLMSNGAEGCTLGRLSLTS